MKGLWSPQGIKVYALLLLGHIDPVLQRLERRLLLPIVLLLVSEPRRSDLWRSQYSHLSLGAWLTVAGTDMLMGLLRDFVLLRGPEMC